ncbi:cilia- and flagella-associated protein 97 [Electrophorus electricus]|uniref:cilia- and flagella-associated protein 97 n=1 Tax=Electrophorus electricus TaxID=8005 RepID=UPI0015CF8948|nr:cilia- and flagella-associated protein 97 [Electrophorus electricus]XP_035385661.1 cilia- and flagella-associated protein 97 [Electrophorus electricus]XP_035385662.1 cilia- and flagella-associated protein 97 [Electrophorus electricus]XP_035385664.1 cilia- and flagella-associated protein 97 [Electrophorus electricus]
MYSPKELEGEVDHSFFDSDCEVGSAELGRPIHEGPEEAAGSQTENLQTERRTEKGGRTDVTDKQGETAPEEEAGVKRLEEDFSGLQVRTWERKDQSEDAESGKEECSHWRDERMERGEEESRERRDHSNLKEERKGKFETDVLEQRQEAESGREDSGASSRKSSPLPHSDGSESRRNSQSDDSSSVRSYSSVEPRSEDDDESVGSEEERPPEPQPPEHNLQVSINPIANKLAGKFRTRSQGCLSSSERESSSSSDEKGPTFPQNPSITQAVSSPPQQPRRGSANQRERRTDPEMAESEDTVTDVTPLSTPDISPEQSFDRTAPDEPSAMVARQQLQDMARGLAVAEEDRAKRDSSDTDGQERTGRRLGGVSVVSGPGSTSTSTSSCGRRRRRRKNYSFTDEEVRRIERENQRLLRELSRTPPRTCSAGSALVLGGRRPAGPPTLRLYHTALNRQREQQRIQRENLAFLKRLESVKPTPGMTRSEQLADYQRQAGYLGIPNSLIRPLSGRSSRSCSTNGPHRTRPETAKPSRTPPPRPAWN